jgi:hypothetical protein
VLDKQSAVPHPLQPRAGIRAVDPEQFTGPRVGRLPFPQDREEQGPLVGAQPTGALELGEPGTFGEW